MSLDPSRRISEYTADEALTYAGIHTRARDGGVMVLAIAKEQASKSCTEASALLLEVAKVLRRINLQDELIPLEVVQTVAEARDRLTDAGYTG